MVEKELITCTKCEHHGDTLKNLRNMLITVESVISKVQVQPPTSISTTSLLSETSVRNEEKSGSISDPLIRKPVTKRNHSKLDLDIPLHYGDQVKQLFEKSATEKLVDHTRKQRSKSLVGKSEYKFTQPIKPDLLVVPTPTTTTSETLESSGSPRDKPKGILKTGVKKERKPGSSAKIVLSQEEEDKLKTTKPRVKRRGTHHIPSDYWEQIGKIQNSRPDADILDADLDDIPFEFKDRDDTPATSVSAPSSSPVSPRLKSSHESDKESSTDDAPTKQLSSPKLSRNSTPESNRLKRGQINQSSIHCLLVLLLQCQQVLCQIFWHHLNLIPTSLLTIHQHLQLRDGRE
eukprot:TRINITY_DN7072_c0_g1_i3.p1 TRINITY_DN7072_c0_g1~~TRINITY_DN7072_c0_g1_i3.p1  ORF type:complete len:364 (-),score=67.76 TRINITY_DN7072_c0_g1_i3:317-1357(-)